MVVGLTGCIGSGKTTVLKEFEKLLIPVYIADIEAKKIMRTNVSVKGAIKELLGEESYVGEDLDRGYIADKVFHNKELLNQLNKIVHPAVHKHFKEFVKKQTTRYLVYENAILFENKNELFCDKVIVVTATEKNRIDRVMKRDGVSKEDVLARMKNQWSQEDKIAKADFILENMDALRIKEQVLKIHKQLIQN